MIGSDEGIKMGSTDGRFLFTVSVNVDVITLGIYFGTDLGYLYGSFDGFNYRKLEGLLIGDALGYTDGKVLGSYKGIKMGLSGGKVFVAILGNVDLITWDLLMVTARRLRSAPVASRAVYHAIGACIILSIAVTSFAASAQVGLIWLLVHVMVVGWVFEGVGCHATSKVVELSCELDYAISFWSWILTWKYTHFVELSTFRGYYPHFVEIFTFRGYYQHFLYISVFCGYYPHFVEISTFLGYCLHFVHSISHILLI